MILEITVPSVLLSIFVSFYFIDGKTLKSWLSLNTLYEILCFCFKPQEKSEQIFGVHRQPSAIWYATDKQTKQKQTLRPHHQVIVNIFCPLIAIVLSYPVSCYSYVSHCLFLFWIHLSYLAFPHLKLIFFILTDQSLTNNFNHSNGRTHHFLRLWFMFLQCNRIFQNLSFTHTLSPPQFCDEIITHKKHTSLARVINKTFIINHNALLSKLLLTHLLQTIIIFCLNSNHH